MSQHNLAKAVYDNIAEAADELGFKKGDILTVLEQDTNGLSGWWLCSLNGRHGIAPGNRLKVIHTSCEDTSYSSPSRVKLPQRIGNVFISASQLRSLAGCDYDTPKSHSPSTDPAEWGVYDVPPVRDVLPQSPISSSSTNSSTSTYTDGEYSGAFSSGGSTSSTYDTPLPFRDISMTVQHGRQHSHPSVRTLSKEELHRHSWHDHYNHPPPRSTSASNMAAVSPVVSSHHDYDHVYDVPILSKDHDYDTPPTPASKSTEVDYDMPKTPLSNRNKPADGVSPSVTWPRKLKPGFGRSRARVENDYDDYVYDIPPQVSRDTDGSSDRCADDVYDVPMMSSVSLCNSKSIDSISSTLSADVVGGTIVYKETGQAIAELVKLQQAADGSVSHLRSFVSSSWRTKKRLEARVPSIRRACSHVKTALKELISFAETAANNALSNSNADPILTSQLAKQVQSLLEKQEKLTEHSGLLDGMNWDVGKLAVHRQPAVNVDNLDQFILVAQSIPESSKQTCIFIQRHIQLFFPTPIQQIHSITNNNINININNNNNIGGRDPFNRPTGPPPALPCRNNSVQARPLPTPPPLRKEMVVFPPVVGKKHEYDEPGQTVPSNKTWLDDHDYIHLQNRDDFDRLQKKILSDELDNDVSSGKDQSDYESLKSDVTKSILDPPNNNITNCSPSLHRVDSTDHQTLVFYGQQIDQILLSLLKTVDAFYNCIKIDQPPNVFIAYSKFFVLCAYKLIYIGDVVFKNLKHDEIKSKVLFCTNMLCESLEKSVNSTKTAALQFPCVSSVQSMVDSVAELSEMANEMKLVINLSISEQS